MNIIVTDSLVFVDSNSCHSDFTALRFMDRHYKTTKRCVLLPEKKKVYRIFHFYDYDLFYCMTGKYYGVVPQCRLGVPALVHKYFTPGLWLSNKVYTACFCLKITDSTIPENRMKCIMCNSLLCTHCCRDTLCVCCLYESTDITANRLKINVA